MSKKNPKLKDLINEHWLSNAGGIVATGKPFVTEEEEEVGDEFTESVKRYSQYVSGYFK